MTRDPDQLRHSHFDLLVIGGGIYGACIAWDGALRGLSVALVDQGDFGGCTSANSLKILHGGLRYLQDFKPKLIRSMTKERQIWMRIAPHLVNPLACLIPTNRRLARSKATFAAAIMLNDLIGFDRNRGIPAEKQIPGGKVISRDELENLLPNELLDGATGAAIWHDAQVRNTERLLLSVVKSATNHGAVAVNYMRVTRLLSAGNRIEGVATEDTLSGQRGEIRARMIVNAAGPWVDSFFDLAGSGLSSSRLEPSIGLNVLTRQILSDRFAVCLPTDSSSSNGRNHNIFIVPWRGYSLIGTVHLPLRRAKTKPPPLWNEVNTFLAEINRVCPTAELTEKDIRHVYAGFLPAEETAESNEEVALLREGQILDHEKREGVAGLISVIGVKYTAARLMAEKTVDLLFKKLKRKISSCRTSSTPVVGGNIERVSAFLNQAIKEDSEVLSPEAVKYLVGTYGSRYGEIVQLVREDPTLARPVSKDSPVIAAEVVHSVRREMAQTIADVVFRRTELGAFGRPDSGCIDRCAQLVALEQEWGQVKTLHEIDRFYELHPVLW
jgi:glycerol-3-phosphate dehydrogenase